MAEMRCYKYLVEANLEIRGIGVEPGGMCREFEGVANWWCCGCRRLTVRRGPGGASVEDSSLERFRIVVGAGGPARISPAASALCEGFEKCSWN